ncbi:hypothetical protein D9M69_701860 [compost metagenome]
MPTALADDKGEFTFPVKTLRERGAQHHVVVRGQAVVEAQEERRVFAVGALGLRHMALVVEADADQLARVGNHRQQAHLRGSQRIARSHGGLGQPTQGVGRDHGLQDGEPRLEAGGCLAVAA